MVKLNYLKNKQIYILNVLKKKNVYYKKKKKLILLYQIFAILVLGMKILDITI